MKVKKQTAMYKYIVSSAQAQRPSDDLIPGELSIGKTVRNKELCDLERAYNLAYRDHQESCVQLQVPCSNASVGGRNNTYMLLLHSVSPLSPAGMFNASSVGSKHLSVCTVFWSACGHSSSVDMAQSPPIYIAST